MTYEQTKRVNHGPGWCLFLVFTVWFFAPGVSFADLDPVAAVQCDAVHNRASIRFGTSETDTGSNGSPLNDGKYSSIPAKLSASWAGIPYQFAGKCRFANGEVFTVSEYWKGPELNWRYGTNFSLTIDGHLTYDRYVFYWVSRPAGRHGGQSSYPAQISAVFYDGGRLTQCTVSEIAQSWQNGSKTECHDVSDRLSKNYEFTDQYEKAALALVQARLKVASALSPFCKSLDFSEGGSKGFGKTSKLIEDINHKYRPNLVREDLFGIAELDIDISNSGKIDRVFDLSGGTDDTPTNEILVWFPKNPSIADDFAKNVAHQRVGSSLFGSKIEVEFTKQQQEAMVQVGNQVSGDELLNDENVPAGVNEIFVLDGKTYIYSQSGHLPLGVSARILQVTADESIKTVCELPIESDAPL